MKNFFSNCNIAISGNFGEGKSPEKIEQWIKSAGGTLCRVVCETTTHVVCSDQDWQYKAVKIKNSLSKFKTVPIVTFEWLEDSLNKRRALATRQYSFLLREKSTRKEERLLKAKDEAKRSFIKSCNQAHDDLCKATYHIYRDPYDIFEYNVSLRRMDIDRKRPESYRLTIYESNAAPHLYATAARYSRSGASSAVVLAPTASYFPAAFGAFKTFFQQRTGYSWDDRSDPPLQQAGSEVSLFRYTLPVLGKPRGVLVNEEARKLFAREYAQQEQMERAEKERAEFEAAEMQRATEIKRRLAQQMKELEWEDPQA
ncbi:MAG: hypothetical protein M1814_005479 [Vezdaea aestivalis]|nr:MAG: hypothetical protein M1814_005479 [Vezdaea aestivalis]